MLLAGLRRTHVMSSAGETTAAQWREFAAAPPPGARSAFRYGALCGSDVDRREFDYLTAAEVEGPEGLPEHLERLSVPAARYAVFVHQQGLTDLREAWSAILTKWLPTSGFNPGERPEFERLDGRFDFKTGEGAIELWFPITE